MPKPAAKRVREQVVVYLDERDRKLLEQLTKTTGLAKTELFRRGLRRLRLRILLPVQRSPLRGGLVQRRVRRRGGRGAMVPAATLPPLTITRAADRWPHAA